MAITPLPTLDRTSATFRASVDTFFGSQLPTFATEANALQVDVNAKQAAALSSADTAYAAMVAADASKLAAAASAAAALADKNLGATARIAAEAALDSFDDRYLGAKAAAPTLDNDGAALITGALYWDATIPGMRAYNGADWVTVIGATAAAITNTPAGNIAAVTVQAAINELDAEKVATTAVIAIAQGGTGASAANAAADAIGAFRRGTILGPVSQSAGVPTGAEFEYGANANGAYLRLPDGTQICFVSGSTAIVTTTSAGGVLGFYGTLSLPFPAVFSSMQSAIVSGARQGYSGYVELFSKSTTAIGLVVNATTSGTYTYDWSYIAIGRWF